MIEQAFTGPIFLTISQLLHLQENLSSESCSGYAVSLLGDEWFAAAHIANSEPQGWLESDMF
jgi:hypothetical protein